MPLAIANEIVIWINLRRLEGNSFRWTNLKETWIAIALENDKNLRWKRFRGWQNLNSTL